MSQTRNDVFRDSALCYVTHRNNGEIESISLAETGVCLPKFG